MRSEKVLQFAVAAHPDADVRPRARRPRGSEPYPEPGGPDVTRELLQSPRRRHPQRNGAHRAHLEHSLLNSCDLSDSAQDGFEGRGELRLLECSYLSDEAPRGRLRALVLCDRAPGGALEVGEQGPRGHVLRALPSERRPELDNTGGAGRDNAGGLVEEERDRASRAVLASDEEIRAR
jgi:hypothetical protein